MASKGERMGLLGMASRVLAEEWAFQASMFALFSAALLSINLHALIILMSLLPAQEVTDLLQSIQAP